MSATLTRDLVVTHTRALKLPGIARTLRAKMTSTATTTHAHQRWRK